MNKVNVVNEANDLYNQINKDHLAEEFRRLEEKQEEEELLVHAATYIEEQEVAQAEKGRDQEETYDNEYKGR